MSTKPRVLVIGGKLKNVPAWANAAFEVSLLDQDSPKARIEPPEHRPAAIVLYTGAVSHQHSSQAHEMGADWDIPVLKARNGWSTAVEQAAKVGATWFVDAVQGGAAATNDEETLEAVNNAWRNLAEHEGEKCEALEKRLRKVQGKLDKAEGVIGRLRSGAEERILSEIRRRAAEVRRQREELARERAAVATIARRVLEWLTDGQKMVTDLERAEQLHLRDEVDSPPA